MIVTVKCLQCEQQFSREELTDEEIKDLIELSAEEFADSK